jgi:hypothetical protein
LDLLQDAKLRTALMPLTDAMDAQIAKLFGL